MVRKLMAVSVLACGAWLVVPATSASAAPLCEQLSGTGVLLLVAPNQPACAACAAWLLAVAACMSADMAATGATVGGPPVVAMMASAPTMTDEDIAAASMPLAIGRAA